MFICGEKGDPMSEKKPYALETRVKVVTWNLWWRFGPWQERQGAIVETLKSLDADIIALQEIWFDGDNSTAAELAAQLGYHYIAAQCMVMNDTGFGNAILSRWPIAEQDEVTFTGLEETGENRNAIYGLIEGPRGNIPVFCTHLNYKYEQSHIRQQQVAELAEFVDSKRPWKFPPVVCGDFNAEPDSDEMRMLVGLTTVPVKDLCFVDAWNVAGEGAGVTWSNNNAFAVEEFEPDRRIDYILVGHPKYRGAGHVTDCVVTGDQPVNGITPSDHYAVMAKLRY